MKKDANKLKKQLDSYIENGYLDIHSFDNPEDEASEALINLFAVDEALCEQYCKLILESPGVGDAFLDSGCLLHLFDLNKEYGLNYVRKNVLSMAAPVLGAAMIGLFEYSNTPFRDHFSAELITNVKKRYDELVSEDDFTKELLDSRYSLFEKEFLISKEPI
ncbi:hypothetical protein [Photorhabdus hindustanensis]|uniref:Uncharacterized protein n=1 Tax=Photorhabdus hindustanensis TaxID=2918802 RepID=A0A2S8PX03_9GAMM|nr:hypothetical protein [Photorhabdus hindustanensis]PQQ23559.1 hypothetical protein C6H66_19110 [Photorhabdus hindustanensis]